jgi:hypothetical protein
MATFGTTIGSGGFRFYDAGHDVSYNYVEGVYGGNFQGPLVLDSGDAEGSSTSLAGHWRVVNATVTRNVLVGNPEGIRVGNNYSLAPTGCTISDNIVAQAGTGTAVTQKIAPVSTTIANNLYGSTPTAVSLVADTTGIYRRAGYGPRLTFLQAGDVGINGDLNDSDGTGTLIGGSTGGPGTTDPTTAAGVFGWGAPLPSSDEFTSGTLDPAKWVVYSGAGYNGNGARLPARVNIVGGVLTITGLTNGDSGGLAHKLNQQYGRWEIRVRSYRTADGPGP